MDWDKNGVISPIEFKSYLANLKKGEELNSEEVYSAFDKIDADGSKQIQWEEFLVSRAVACVIKLAMIVNYIYRVAQYATRLR